MRQLYSSTAPAVTPENKSMQTPATNNAGKVEFLIFFRTLLILNPCALIPTLRVLSLRKHRLLIIYLIDDL